MKIAFITPTFNLGGYEKVVISYANELAKRGHNVFLLCGFRQGELLDSVSSNVQIVEFRARLRTFLFPLIQFLKKTSPDILYSGFRGYNAVSVLARRIARSTAVVYASQHGFEKASGLDTWIMGKLIARAQCQIAVAEDIAIYEKKCLNLDQNYNILYNPVVNRENPIRDEQHPWFRENIPIIVLSGRLAKDKAKDVALRIFAEARKCQPLRLLILGDGPERKTMEEMVRTLRIEKDVDFLGFVANPLGYLQHCSLLLHTPVVEGFGNVLVESLLAGVPVVITDCTGPLEIIGRDNRYGICIGKTQDPCCIANGVEAICAIVEHRIDFSGLRERALDFDVSTTTDRFLEIYDEYRNNFES